MNSTTVCGLQDTVCGIYGFCLRLCLCFDRAPFVCLFTIASTLCSAKVFCTSVGECCVHHAKTYCYSTPSGKPPQNFHHICLTLLITSHLSLLLFSWHPKETVVVIDLLYFPRFRYITPSHFTIRLTLLRTEQARHTAICLFGVCKNRTRTAYPVLPPFGLVSPFFLLAAFPRGLFVLVALSLKRNCFRVLVQSLTGLLERSFFFSQLFLPSRSCCCVSFFVISLCFLHFLLVLRLVNVT